MKSDSGFSLIELLVAMTIMLVISGAAMTAILKLTSTQAMIWNRTQMHSGIRGATEVLQQEVGQAGRIALPTAVTLNNPGGYTSGVNSLTVTSTTGMFAGEQLTIGTGTNLETVTVSNVTSGTAILLAAVTASAHNNGDPVAALGGFYAGVVPKTTTNGSTDAVLKLFGDINADGNMVYVEYSVSPACICAQTPCANTTGNLYRNSMAWNAGSKTPASASQILLGNVTANPNGATCFTYQPATVIINGTTTYNFVTDVAVTLTVQTQNFDPVTKSYQTETKALLNVSPRNVFNTWELASSGYTERLQPTPASITALLAGAS